jgi:nitrate reductase NapE component
MSLLTAIVDHLYDHTFPHVPFMTICLVQLLSVEMAEFFLNVLLLYPLDIKEWIKTFIDVPEKSDDPVEESIRRDLRDFLFCTMPIWLPLLNCAAWLYFGFLLWIQVFFWAVRLREANVERNVDFPVLRLRLRQH